MKTTIDIPEDELLIYACARVHGLDLAYDDAHFDDLGRIDAGDR